MTHAALPLSNMYVCLCEGEDRGSDKTVNVSHRSIFDLLTDRILYCARSRSRSPQQVSQYLDEIS